MIEFGTFRDVLADQAVRIVTFTVMFSLRARCPGRSGSAK